MNYERAPYAMIIYGHFPFSFSRLSSAMASPSFSFANKLFVQRNLTLVDAFLADAEKLYSSAAGVADFACSPSETQVGCANGVRALSMSNSQRTYKFPPNIRCAAAFSNHPSPTAQTEHARDPKFCREGPQGTRFWAIFEFD